MLGTRQSSEPQSEMIQGRQAGGVAVWAWLTLTSPAGLEAVAVRPSQAGSKVRGRAGCVVTSNGNAAAPESETCNCK